MNDSRRDTRVVGIGASAGAMDPLKEFFTMIGSETGLAFVVVQHLAPNHVSYMSEVLARQTGMKVIQATDRAQVKANCVYTIPPNKYISLEDGVLRLSEPIKRDGLRLPIDFFFRSLAHDYGADAIAVLLSGGGSDGTLGIREIRGAGGLVIVQNPETAQFDSMIESAIATGLVDFVLPVPEMPAKLLQYVRQVSATDGTTPQTISAGINAILELLVNETRAISALTKRLLNLCLNARDAMPSGGTLTLKTSLVNRNAVRNAVPNSEEVTAEQYVRIDVNDSGEGIDENVLGRIFEPFFTTKGAGRGTGLRLAVVYGILKHHKGSIQVKSKRGAGTSFQIYLPVMRPSD